jgi:hypothetical protein
MTVGFNLEPTPDPRNREIFQLRAALVVAVVAAGIGIWAAFDARDNAENIKAALTHQLQSTQEALDTARAENAAVASVSLDTFLRQYNAHVAKLKTAAQAYEAAKAAKGSDVVGSDAAGAVAGARNELYAATDTFTHFVDLWRAVAEPFNILLDGNATQLENSRREDNANDVHDAARRIVNSAPDLAAPLRVALDKLKSPPPK